MKVTRTGFVLIFLFVSNSVFSQNLDLVIEQYFEAIGGRNKWMEIRSIRKESISYNFPQKNVFADQKIDTTEMILEMKRPDKTRVTLKKNGKTSIMSYDGISFYRCAENKLTELPIEHGIYFNSMSVMGNGDFFINPKNELDYLGVVEFEGVEYYGVKIKNPDWFLPYYVLFDRETNLISVVYAYEDKPTYNKEYKEFNGIKFPTITEYFSSNILQSREKIGKIIIDYPLMDDYFNLTKNKLTVK